MGYLTTVARFGVVLILLTPFAVGAQIDDIAYHDFSTMAPTPLGRIQVKAVLTESSSFAISEVPPGMRQTAHHHDQEQIMIGLGGSMEFSIDGTVHRLDTYGAAIPPSNTTHYYSNSERGIGTFLEFQPVRRADWLPPYPPATTTRSPQPIPLTAGQRLSTNFAVSSDGWRAEANGARVKSLSGQTIRVSVWDLSASTASLNLGSAMAERFAYVLEGKVAVANGPRTRDLGSGMLVVISRAARDVRLTPIGASALVAVFESDIR